MKSMFFGSYYQFSGHLYKTPIEWLILEQKENSVLLISKYALDTKAYDAYSEFNPNWETCHLRKWLNHKFYQTAFSSSEHKQIINSKISLDDSLDKVYLLSAEEAQKYLTENELMCEPTDYVVNSTNSFINDDDPDEPYSCWWWLRSPSPVYHRTATVNACGVIDLKGDLSYRSDICVRPVIRIYTK